MLPFNVVSALFPKQPQVTCQSVYNTPRSTLTMCTAFPGPSLDHWNHPCLWGRSSFQKPQAGPSPLTAGVWPWSTHSSPVLPKVYERPHHYPHNYNDCKFMQHFKLTGFESCKKMIWLYHKDTLYLLYGHRIMQKCKQGRGSISTGRISVEKVIALQGLKEWASCVK